MTDVSRFFDTTIIVYRIKQISGFKRGSQATVTIEAHIQREDDRDTTDVYGVQGVVYRAWVDLSANVKEGDLVQDQNDNRYTVLAVEYLDNNFAMNEHKEIILKEYHARVSN